MPTYTVITATLNHISIDAGAYKHDAPFIDGDVRAIQYDKDGNFPIAQVFRGSTNVGGWYDLE